MLDNDIGDVETYSEIQNEKKIRFDLSFRKGIAESR